ncbi:timeless-domain-containing protein [Choiromyces venosus 120613-1]|uniref:Topoisomerase 1-associated factor 1 n=1 Tax=Choiromyces venosus 120613-1 TaxID=1336337 RepID=A0A3N4JDY3_9PEZI|nr:timeless-domain-containing protein [Choiromyces venosus 120613-1]
MSGDEEDNMGPSKMPETVDPMIRAHILSLCSALGGTSTVEDGGYSLGDEALACLKDLKKWLKLYDQKMNRFDVARCMAEANLVKGDLLEILGAWEEDEIEDRMKQRLALGCVELLVPLTWPFERYNEQTTINHHRHIPVLQFAQASYKKAILQHPSKRILSNIVRVALPSIELPPDERTERDEGIIKLAIYFFRNLVMIEHPMITETDTGEEISRSATIEVLEDQNVLHFLLMLASEMGNEFNTQDVVVMEVIYHLVKSVDIEKMFLTDEQEAQKQGQDLTALLKLEDEMKRTSIRGASTRHNRFGTTVWIERDDKTRSFVSGQGALLGKSTGLDKMDSSKKWKKPGGADSKGVSRKTEHDMSLTLERRAKTKLREFVEDFLDACFNPLFSHLRRAIDRDAQRLVEANQQQYFYLIAWFLKAERIRRKTQTSTEDPASADLESFGLVASVLNQESLITLNRRMTEWFDTKQWTPLQSAMRCFTQILLTVQDMAVSPLEDDQEIAENIQNRLFYEEVTLDLVVMILRAYTRQPFGWLDDCTEMVHVHLKMLERFSKQHDHMFIRSRKRARAQRKKNATPGEDAAGDVPEEGDEEDEEMAELSRATMKERAFDYSRFEQKFLTPSCVNTFLAFIGNYKELNYSQMKRAITFFHRVFVKRGQEVLLFRIDIVELFNRILQGPEGLPSSHPARKEMDQFFKHYMRRLVKMLEKRPELYVELLFTKVNSTMHYLQFGYDKEVKVSKPREAAELRIKPGLEFNEQVSVAVGALLDENKGDAVDWLKTVLAAAISERKSWEAEEEARLALEAEAAGADPETNNPQPASNTSPSITIKPDSDTRQTALLKDAKLRLLLSTLKFEKLATAAAAEDAAHWIIPSQLTSIDLQSSLDLLKLNSDNPPTFPDGQLAEDFISRKPKPRPQVSDSDSDSGQEIFFEPGGPTPMPGAEKPKKKPSKKRHRRNDPSKELELDSDLEDEAAKQRALARRQKEKEKLAAIKSSLFVHDSDDESDEERDRIFYESERLQREMGPVGLTDEPQMDFMEYGFGGVGDGNRKKKRKNVSAGGGGKKKRRAEVDGGSDVDVDVDMRDEGGSEDSARDNTPEGKSVFGGQSGDEDSAQTEEEEEEEEVPKAKAKAPKKVKVKSIFGGEIEDEEGEEEPLVKSRTRPRRRGPVIASSDEEEE